MAAIEPPPLAAADDPLIDNETNDDTDDFIILPDTIPPDTIDITAEISSSVQKKGESKVFKKPAKMISDCRLPDPCPVPTVFSKKTMVAIQSSQLEGTKKLALLREASLYYYGYCQNPTSDEYSTMAKMLCEQYPQLKDKQYKFHDWV